MHIGVCCAWTFLTPRFWPAPQQDGTRTSRRSLDGACWYSRRVMPTCKSPMSPGASARFPAAPDGFTVYVLGDIHGRLDLLLEVQRRVDEDKAKFARGRIVEVYLGDYIDRGPDPAGVVSQLIDRAR